MKSTLSIQVSAPRAIAPSKIGAAKRRDRAIEKSPAGGRIAGHAITG